MALLLSVGWWFSSPSEWEPIISAVLATVGLLSIGRGTKSGPTTASVESDGLVVLPFEEAGSADLHGSFGYTLTQEIVRSLSRIRSLRVIAATSSFQLKGTTKDVVTIARELGVRYVLSGRVGRAAEAVRISLELVDGFDSTHVWGETYTSMLDELLDLDEEVGRAIAAALEVKLTPEEDRRLAQRAIDHLHARQCYLRAQQEIYRLTEESLGKARQLLENGLSLMGPNDLLLAALGDVHFQLYNVVGGDRMNLLAAEQYARRALDLNPDSAIAL